MRMAVKQSRCQLVSESLQKMTEHASDRGLSDTWKKDIDKDWTRPRNRGSIKAQSWHAADNAHAPSFWIISNCCHTKMKAHLCDIKAEWRTSCGCVLHEAFQINVQELED